MILALVRCVNRPNNGLNKPMLAAMKTLFWMACLGLFPALATAQDDDLWGEEWAAEKTGNWSFSQSLQLGYGHRYRDDKLFTKQQTLNEFRWHAETKYKAESFDFELKGDLLYDQVRNQAVLDLRALNLAFSPFSQTDITLGRQVVTWGIGDLLFLNDWFNKDWKSFFAGRDDRYLKAPNNAVRIQSYYSLLNIDLLIMPKFESDRFIDGERFSLFFPMSGQQVGGSDVIDELQPNKPEYALRLFKQFNGTELAFYAYRGFDKRPQGLTVNFRPTFHRKQSVGVSVRGNLGGGIYSAEFANHRALDDLAGSNPLIKNSQNRWLIGYEKELISKLTWGVQYYVEHNQSHKRLLQHSAAPQFEDKQYREVWTQRLNYMSHQDKLTWSLFVFYSPTDEDSYWRPSLSYRYNDNWHFNFGANIFKGGYPHSFFGQFTDSSNLYSRIHYYF